MKLIIKIFLLIICLGLLISCANNVDLSKIFNEDKTTQTTNTNNHSTTLDNNTTNNDITEPSNQLYSHNIRIYYDSNSYPDFPDYTEQIETFDFSFKLISESSQSISSYDQLYEVSSNGDFVSIDSFDGTIIYNSVEYNVTGIKLYEAGIAVLVNNTNNQINLDSLDHSYYIFDSVSLYE